MHLCRLLQGKNKLESLCFIAKRASMQFSHPAHVLIDPLCPPSLLHPQPAHPIPLIYPDHNRQILQHLLPREISTESFTHLLFHLCPLSSSVFPCALFSLPPPSLVSFLLLPRPPYYSFAAAGTEPEWRKLSHRQRFTSSTSTTATWVTSSVGIRFCDQVCEEKKKKKRVVCSEHKHTAEGILVFHSQVV